MPPSPADLRVLRILHLALCASVVIYGGVAFAATPAAEPGWTPPSQILLYVLAGVGLTTLIVVAPTMRRALIPPDADAGKLRTGSIVVWALCESVAVEGLVASFVYKEPLYILPFAAGALAGLVVFAPRSS